MKKCGIDKLCASEFRHLITIQQRGTTKDEIGGQVTTWTTFAQPWAKAEPWRGNQRTFAGKIDNPAGMDFTIRYVAGLLPSMRVSWGSRLFDIIHPQNIEERGIYIKLRCQENVGT